MDRCERAGVPLFRTDHDGAITPRKDGQNLEVHAFAELYSRQKVECGIPTYRARLVLGLFVGTRTTFFQMLRNYATSLLRLRF
jgi:hypothetical protein